MISKKQKKGLRHNSGRFFTQFRKFKRLRGGSFRMGGAIFHFSQKIGLKSTKNMLFCILHKPMGGARAPPWLRYWIQNKWFVSSGFKFPTSWSSKLGPQNFFSGRLYWIPLTATFTNSYRLDFTAALQWSKLQNKLCIASICQKHCWKIKTLSLLW